MPVPVKILIVGGGFTGLTAALRLAQAGNHEITLIESSGQLGGLAAGFPLEGTWLEKTYHHLFLSDGHRETRRGARLEGAIVVVRKFRGSFSGWQSTSL